MSTTSRPPSDPSRRYQIAAIIWQRAYSQAANRRPAELMIAMWPFNSSAPQVDSVELPSNNNVSQSNADQTDPTSTKSFLDTIRSRDQPSIYHRIGFHPINHVQALAGVAFIAGGFKGVKEGADVASLCFRAENAHLTPTSKAGWFLYNKSKNYHTVLGAAKQGIKTGAVYFGWTTLFLTLEHGLDAARGRVFASRREKEMGRLAGGQADFLNTVSAAVAVAGIHGWWYRMDRFAAARMTRGAVLFSVPFGLGQDLYAWLVGQNTWYVDGIARLVRGTKDEQGEFEPSLQRERKSV